MASVPKVYILKLGPEFLLFAEFINHVFTGPLPREIKSIIEATGEPVLTA